MTNAYATNETAADLWVEQSINAGTYIGAVAYGMHVIVFFSSVHQILRRPKPSLWQLIFIFILFVCGSLNIACNINFNELTWIDDRNYPGGPFAFIMGEEDLAVNVIANAVVIVSTCLADGFLLYRAFVLWNRRWVVVILPCLIYVASVVLSVFFVYQAAAPDSSLWAQSTFQFAVPYWSLSMSLNIIVTLMLVIRIMWMRRQVAATLGLQHTQAYTSIAAMLVECALPYGLVSFIFIVLYAKHNTGENLFIPLLAQVQCIAPELIILRVAKGRAWSESTLDSLSTSDIQFAERPIIEIARSEQTTSAISATNDISKFMYKESFSSGFRGKYPSSSSVQEIV